MVVASGKGGTGKTSLTASLAALAGGQVLADADVDGANLHLLLQPVIGERHDFTGGAKALIDPRWCTACGRCLTACRFGAVRVSGQDEARAYEIEPLVCEGCGICALVCPTDAIRCDPASAGHWCISDTRHGPLVHARLNPGGESSGKLVSLIRQQARRLAAEQGRELVIVDGPPGIACPVIASLTGADIALLVAEPSVAGLHDFHRIAALAGHFGVAAALCVNRWDLNTDLTEALERSAKGLGMPVAGRISYSRVVSEAQRQGLSIVEANSSPVADEVRRLWVDLQPLLQSAGDTAGRTAAAT